MTEPTVPASIAPSRDHAPPSDRDRRAIDLAPSAAYDCLDDGTRADLARAGQEALEACLSRFSPAERAAFWFAIGRCYNRPYNPPEAVPVEVAVVDATPREFAAVPLLAMPLPTMPLPAAHVIDAVRPGPEAARPEAALR